MAAVVASSAASTSSSTTSPLLSLLSDPDSSTLIKQGAEAKVYKSYPTGRPSSSSSSSSSTPWLLKYRFPKTYRHPHLSQTITAQRTVSEARALVRCARYGVEVPVVELVDDKEGILVLEWIDGNSVREWLGGGAEDDEVGVTTHEADEQAVDAADEGEDEEGVALTPEEQLQLMTTIGHQLALMHAADVIHGDLTTSNLMVRSTPSTSSPSSSSFRVVVIDFGLSFTSSLIEDKAVDLYVLERAFLSTHPHSAHLFERVLQSYGERIGQLWRMGAWRRGIGGTADESAGGKKGGKKQQKGRTTAAAGANVEADKAVASVTAKGDAALDALVEATRKAVVATTPAGQGGDPWRDIRKRLDEVRMRGRKRSMVG